MKITNPAIPFDSIVVVIGASSYIGVETGEKLLQAGYRVRGTVRDVNRNDPWTHQLFNSKSPSKFELVTVTDFEAEGTFDEAFKSAAGVIYVSTPVVFDTDPSKVIDPTVKSTLITLEAAARAGVWRYVLSSSSKAVESPDYSGPSHELTAQTFNHEQLVLGKQESEDKSFDRAYRVLRC